MKRIYLQSLYLNRIAYGKRYYPWTCDKNLCHVDYNIEKYSMTENSYENAQITHLMI